MRLRAMLLCGDVSVQMQRASHFGICKVQPSKVPMSMSSTVSVTSMSALIFLDDASEGCYFVPTVETAEKNRHQENI